MLVTKSSFAGDHKTPPFNCLRSRLIRPISIIVLLACLATLFTACDNRAEAIELAQTGAESANKLGDFYDSLAQDLIETQEFEYFISSIRGIPVSDAQITILSESVTALRARARTARKLAASYNKLKSLAEKDAGKAIGDAAVRVAESVKALPIIPGSNVIPSQLIGMIAQDIAAWKQSQDIKKAVKLQAVVIHLLEDLISKERSAYESIAEERGNKAGILIDYLITNERVTSLPLLQKVPTSLGLKLIGSDAAVTCPVTVPPTKPDELNDKPNCTIKRGLAKIAIAQFDRQAIVSAAATNTMVNIFSGLAEAHAGFGKKSGIPASNIVGWLERAQAYLDEIEKIRNNK